MIHDTLGRALSKPIWMVAAMLALGAVAYAPVHLYGWFGAVPFVCLGAGVIVGWAAARRYWRKHGFVPKL